MLFYYYYYYYYFVDDALSNCWVGDKSLNQR